MSLSDVFEVVCGGVLGASITAIVGPLLLRQYDAAKQKREKQEQALEEQAQQRKQMIAQLRILQTHLDESLNTFRSQARNRDRLLDMLKQRCPEEVQQHNGKGYDEIFFQLFDQMNAEERGWFDLIRGISTTLMHSVNDKMRKWVTKYFDEQQQIEGLSNQTAQELQTQLELLRDHLNMWFAKYDSILAVNERRSLVYLGDEKRQGKDFPKELAPAVQKALAELE